MSAIKFRRNWVWAMPIFAHALFVAIAGAVAFGLGATELASPTSAQNRFRREPTPEELARGERWFAGKITAIHGLPVQDGESVRPEKDPWNGCAIRREHYVSGKNGGWFFDYAWSRGSVSAIEDVDREGPPPQTADVEIFRIQPDPSRSDPIGLADVRRYLPNEPARDGDRYFRSCVAVQEGITVDGIIDSSGYLRGSGDRDGARIELPSQLHTRLGRSAVLSSLGLLAAGIPLFWIALVVGFFTQSLAFASACRSQVGTAARTFAIPFIGAGIGLALGGVLLLAGIPFPIYVPVLAFAFGVFGAVLKWEIETRATLLRMKLVFSGKSHAGVSFASGRIPDDKPRVPGRLRPALHAFTFFEIFQMGPKAAIGARVAVFPSTEEVVATSNEGAFTFGASDATYVCDSTEVRMKQGVFTTINPDPPRFMADEYWVRESYIEESGTLTVVGRSKGEPDHDPYRTSGATRVFDGAPLVFGHSSDVVKKRIARDLAIHHFYFALLFGWLAIAGASLVTIARAGFWQ